jgi:hypothetical protein
MRFSRQLSKDSTLTQRKINLIYLFSIRFFADFTQQPKKKGANHHPGLLIITDSQLLYILDFKELKFHCELLNVTRCEVFEEKIALKR